MSLVSLDYQVLLDVTRARWKEEQKVGVGHDLEVHSSLVECQPLD